MDPVTIVGLAASALQIAQFIGSTIQGLHTLKGKFENADKIIVLLIHQLTTIKSAVIIIDDWAQWNSEGSPKVSEFMLGLGIALDGCQTVIDVLSTEVKDLMTVLEAAPGTATMGIRARAKVVWNDATMKDHQNMLSAQVQALALLLQARQWYDNQPHMPFLHIYGA